MSTAGVQRKMWDTLSPHGEDYISDFDLVPPVRSRGTPSETARNVAQTPHPSRLPMKCIGTAGHPLPQGGEGRVSLTALGRAGPASPQGERGGPLARPHLRAGVLPPPKTLGRRRFFAATCSARA